MCLCHHEQYLSELFNVFLILLHFGSKYIKKNKRIWRNEQHSGATNLIRSAVHFI